MRKSSILFRFALVMISFFSALCAKAYAVELTGSISSNKSNLGYNTTLAQSASLGISFYLSDFIRIGFTHSQLISDDYGYSVSDGVDDSTLSTNDYYKNRTQMTANALDLTLILYQGEVVAPFIFGGAVVKNYKFFYEKADVRATGQTSLGPVPNAGAGLSIRLNRSFSLKLSYTVSPGIRKLPGKDAERVLDTSTSIGLTYML